MTTTDNSRSEVSERAFPVAVIVERRAVHGSKWQTDSWSVTNVIAGNVGDADDTNAKLLDASPECTRFLWGGYCLQLHYDDTEGYYCNLRGKQPSVFIVCEELENEAGIKPQVVTVSADEASSYDEVNEQVYAVPMPAEVYVWLEHYVVENYVPTQRKKRKRKNWSEQERPDA